MNEIEPRNDQSTELAPSNNGSGTLKLDTPKFWTSLDLRTDEGKKLFIRAKGSDCADFDLASGKDFGLVHILCHEAETVDKDSGEVTRWIRNVLITNDGEMIAGGSQGVRSSLADLIALFGNPPFDPPIRVRLKSVKTAQKRKMHQLEIV